MPYATDAHSISSGQRLDLGRNPPSTGGGGTPGDTGEPSSWLPPSGQMKRVSLNNVNAVADINNPDPWLRDNDLRQMLDAWCSTLWCPEYGEEGSIIYSGGGHGDRLSNAVYRYDVKTRIHTRIVDGTPVPVRQAFDSDTVAGNLSSLSPYYDPNAAINHWNEFWTDTTRQTVVEGKMAPTHTYGNMIYVPGAKVGNTNGYFIIMGNFCFIAHYVDLDNLAQGWQRFGGLFPKDPPYNVPISYGSSVYDSIRNRIVSWPFNNGSASYCMTLDVATRVTTTTASGSPDSYYSLTNHMVADDLYLMARLQPFNGVWRMYVIDPTNLGNPIQTTQTGPMPPAGVLTWTWDESRRQFVGWDTADADLWICQAPANPKTGTWVWSKRPYVAQEAILKQTGSNHMFNRLHYSASLDAFFCATRVDGAIQCWKA